MSYCSYGKTKDAFGWPEEPEEISAGQATPAPVASGSTMNNENAVVTPTPLTSVDK